MPKRRRKQDTELAGEMQSGKRARRQRGFYSALLKGSAADRRQSQTDEKLQAVSEAAEVKPQHDVEADETNTGTHHSADGMTFADGLTCTKGTAHTEQVLAHTKRERLCGGKPLIPSSRGRRPKIGGTCSKKKLTPSNQDGPPEAGLACGEKMLMPSGPGEPPKKGGECNRKSSMPSDPGEPPKTDGESSRKSSVPSGPGEPPKTDGVCSRKSTPSGPDKLPQTDREGSRKTSTPSGSGGQMMQKVQTVVAVVHDNVVTAPAMREFLHSQVLPWQHEEVAVEQSESEVTVRGSIEQVQQVLNILAQIKTRTACAPFDLRESTAAGVCSESDTGCNLGYDSLASLEEVKGAASNSQYDQTAVYVVDGRDETGEVPSRLHLSGSTDSKQGIVPMDTGDVIIQEIVQEDIVYMDPLETCSPGDELSSKVHNMGDRATQFEEPAGTTIPHSDSDRSSKRSTLTGLIDSTGIPHPNSDRSPKRSTPTGLTDSTGIPHPNSDRSPKRSTPTGLTDSTGIPHPNSDRSPRRSTPTGLTDSTGIPHPNSDRSARRSTPTGLTDGTGIPHHNSDRFPKRSAFHMDSDQLPKRSTATEFPIPLCTRNSGDQTSTSQTGKEGFCSRGAAQVGSNSAQTLPGLLPLECSLRCGLCDEVCVNNDCVKRHMEVEHASKEEAYRCDVCSLAYPDKRTLLAHLKAKHEAANTTCQICGKKFQCQRYLRTHLQRHAGVKNFECPQCGWRFFERHKLKFHMESHKAEGERCLPYRCQLCAKQFSNKASWSDHCNTHSGHRPFQCTTCGARFGHRVGLRRHKLTHEKVKPFSCSVCSRMFAVKPKLDEHMITHTGVSKHVCPHCQKVFTAASSLRRHSTRCPVAAMLRAKEDSNPGSTVDPSALEASDCPEVESGSLFQCGSCSLCFTTYRQAQQHAVTHEAAGDSAVQDDVVVVPTASTSASPCSSGVVARQSEDATGLEIAQVQYVVEGDEGHAESEGCSVQYIIIHTSSSEDQGQVGHGEEAGGQSVRERGEVTVSTTATGEETVSVEEMEEIQLAASTLADLSAM